MGNPFAGHQLHQGGEITGFIGQIQPNLQQRPHGDVLDQQHIDVEQFANGAGKVHQRADIHNQDQALIALFPQCGDQ
ncbi:hypothetical protein D3C76_1180980 [compost metagenome]